jgi:hypothetical protein
MQITFSLRRGFSRNATREVRPQHNESTTFVALTNLDLARPFRQHTMCFDCQS